MRSALLTPVNLGLIGVWERSARDLWSREEAAILERRDILFGTLVQCGISQFECLTIPESYMPTAEFLRKRLTTKVSDYGTCLFIVKETFERHLGKDFALHPDRDKLNGLFLFVGDLLYSLNRRKSMVSFEKIDELLSTIETLPPELRIPLRNLWALMHRSEPELPVPKREILMGDVADFEQILSSRLFTQYEKKSSELDVASSQEQRSLNEAKGAAQRLVKSNQRYLNLRRTPIRILNLTAKAIDAVFGKLPGNLAEFAASEAQRFLGADKRLVIYSARKLLFEIQEPSITEIQRGLGRVQKN